MQHLIKKQVIALDMPKSAKSFEVQQTMRNIYLQKILPLLEQVFDELSDEEETIFIDQLEIDLGNISESDIALDKWDLKIVSGITGQLYKKINIKKEKPGAHELKSLSVCSQWLFYMEKGFLPWNTLHTNEAWYLQVLEALATDYIRVSELRYLITSNPSVIKRIAEQHPYTFLLKLVEILTAEKQNELADAVLALQQFLSEMKRFDIIADHPSALQKNIWRQIIGLAAVEGRKLTQHELVEKAILFYLPDISIISTMVAKGLVIPSAISPVLKKIAAQPEQSLKKTEADGTEKHTKEKELEKDGEMNIEMRQVQQDENTNNEMYDKQVDEEGIFVLNAGTVLLHAFLTTLLNRLQLVNNGRFANEEAQQKALYLVHYLATGKNNAEEHELIVPKILCAWNLNNPVEKEVELTTEEINEAENMMRSAIEQWTVLKNTSVDGLREGFLQRNGKLYTRNGNLYLQVEHKAIDILLDQLPWNLSIIKLPWMKEILRVEWR